MVILSAIELQPPIIRRRPEQGSSTFEIKFASTSPNTMASGVKRKNEGTGTADLAFQPPSKQRKIELESAKKANENWEKTEWLHLRRNFGEPHSNEELLQQLQTPLIETKVSFECTICLERAPFGTGVQLTECFHRFHRECLCRHVESCNNIPITCPDPQCDKMIVEREIRALLTDKNFAEYLKKSVQAAEMNTRGSFHCKTPNCNGWYILDGPKPLTFECSVCKAENCIKCKAVHTNLTCHDFQNREKEADAEAKTRNKLQQMIERKTAKPCPQCKTLIVKRGGCDHMRCVCLHNFSWDRPTSSRWHFFNHPRNGRYLQMPRQRRRHRRRQQP